MRVLVWQWGRRGAGPRIAASLADGARLIPGTEVALSLSSGAEILASATPPVCELALPAYSSLPGFIWRLAQAPLIVRELAKQIARLRPDVAICAMPGPLDLLMMSALRRNHVSTVVVLHDAEPHPGDGLPLQMFLQRRLLRRAGAVVVLSEYVAQRLRQQRLIDPNRIIVLSLPPFIFGPMPAAPRAHGGPLRLLCFGRLLPYKGLDLLASAMRQIDTDRAWELRVVGSGPESPELAALREVSGVTVENRWVPEDEIGQLIAWSDVVVLPYREASQSGIAPAVIAAGRIVVATRVGGLLQQLRDAPNTTLCEPDAGSLAIALRSVIEAPGRDCSGPPLADPLLLWRDMAQQLLDRVSPTPAQQG
jgi:glycosyltransferase involved in cell wall biosynthesis